MNFTLFVVVILIITGIIILKMMNKEIPKIINFHKNKWEKEQKAKEQLEKYTKKEEKKITDISKERKKEEIKSKRSQMYKDNIQKGKNYEKQISIYFYDKGYKVKEHGLIHGKKDKGIDIIVMKNKEITLIQCKNWKADSKKRIDHVMIKEFIGNCTAFLEKNKESAKNYSVKKLYIVANDILEINAKEFIKDHKETIEYKVIPYLNT